MGRHLTELRVLDLHGSSVRRWEPEMSASLARIPQLRDCDLGSLTVLGPETNLEADPEADPEAGPTEDSVEMLRRALMHAPLARRPPSHGWTSLLVGTAAPSCIR